MKSSSPEHAPGQDAGERWRFDQPEREVEWYRPDPRRRLFRPWLFAVCLVCTGALACALFFINALPEPGAAFLLFCGLGAILGGMLTIVLSALKVLEDETCISLREEGLLYRDCSGEIQQFPWELLDEVSLDRDRRGFITLRIEGRAGYSRLQATSMQRSPEALVERIREVQRHLLLGLDLKLLRRRER